MRAVFDILKILLIERDCFISDILRPDKVAARLRPAGCALLYKFGDILLFLLQPCLVLIVGPPLNIGILIAVKISYIGGFRFSGNRFLCISVGIHRCKSCGSPCNEARRNNDSGECGFLEFHNSFNPFSDSVPAECSSSGNAAPFFQSDESHRVILALAAELFQYCFIAGKLNIPIRECEHCPSQRIEPMNARSGGKNKLHQHVKSADMHKFMRKRKTHFLAVCGQVFRENYHRIYNAVGQRRGHSVAYFYCYFPSKVFCGYVGLNFRIVCRQSLGKLPAAAEVQRCHYPKRDNNSACPDDSENQITVRSAACSGG